ncbi:hypothetical protein [Dactylosporangium sp. NPDC048998]|uniref:hypothetical protein n=1 Tax=Dactylosporangium sp. NPDC048998 TaxID=3363976 RepID=UPI00371C0495
MTIRSWIIGKLQDEYTIHPIGQHGLQIERWVRPTAFVYCVESGTDWFTTADLNLAHQEMPSVEFVVLVKRQAESEAYELADELGICLSTFGELKSALAEDVNIAEHLSREQAYVLSRLGNNRHVDGLRRRGAAVYEISRVGALSTLNIVTVDHYELTSDEVYTLLDRNDNVDLDVIVNTNPNCRGFADEVSKAAEHAGVRVLTFNEFLNDLGKEWA